MRYISITALSFVIRYLHLWGASQRDGLAHTLGAAGREAYLEPLVLEDFFFPMLDGGIWEAPILVGIELG